MFGVPIRIRYLGYAYMDLKPYELWHLFEKCIL